MSRVARGKSRRPGLSWLPALNSLHVVEGGDHSLRVRVRQLQARSETQEDVDRQIFKAINEFVDELPTTAD